MKETIKYINKQIKHYKDKNTKKLYIDLKNQILNANNNRTL